MQASSVKEFNIIKFNLSNTLNQLKIKITEYESLSNNNSESSKNNGSIKIIDDQIINLNSDVFKIMIVGEFSTGKSTFLNSILGEKILPTAIKPTTATINLIKYNEEKKAVVHYFGKKNNESGQEISEGKKEIIPIEKLADYSTSLNDKSDEVSKNIKLVEVLYPNEYCKDGVEILDTPGLNSVYGHHERATTEYLPNGNSGIMLFDAGQFMKKSEKEYLQIFKKYMDKMFFVVNKIDHIDEDEESLEELIPFWKGELKKVLGEDANIKLYPVSALKAVKGKDDESKMLEFLKDFELFLISDEKAQEMIIPPIKNAQGEILKIVSDVQMKTKSFKFSPEGFETKLKANMPKLERAKRRKTEIENSIIERGNFLKDKMKIEFNSLVRIITNSISDTIIQWEGEMEELKDELPKLIKENIADHTYNFQANIESEFKELSNEVSSRINDLIDDLIEFKSSIINVSSAIGVHENLNMNTEGNNFDFVKSIGGSLGIGFAAGFFFMGPVGWIVGLGGTFIWNLFVEEEAKERQLKQIANKVNDQLNEKFTELYPSLENKFRKGVEDMQKQTSDLFNNMINDVEKTIKEIKIEMQNEKSTIEAKTKKYYDIEQDFLNISNKLMEIEQMVRE